MKLKNLFLLLTVALMGCVALSCEEEKTPSNDKTNNPNYKPDEDIRDDQQEDPNGKDDTYDLPDNGDNGDNGTGDNGTGDNGDNGTGGDEGGTTDEEIVLDADYELYIEGEAKCYVAFGEGLRNDYITFYDPATYGTLFIDFYAADTNDYLPSGRYELGAVAAGNCSQEYTYFMRSQNVDFERFSEGYAEVERDERNRYVIHAEYTLLSGETIAMVFKGRLVTD